MKISVWDEDSGLRGDYNLLGTCEEKLLKSRLVHAKDQIGFTPPSLKRKQAMVGVSAELSCITSAVRGFKGRQDSSPVPWVPVTFIFAFYNITGTIINIPVPPFAPDRLLSATHRPTCSSSVSLLRRAWHTLPGEPGSSRKPTPRIHFLSLGSYLYRTIQNKPLLLNFRLLVVILHVEG
nr:uncharacterized protein LOC107394355 [Nothobranchius furzeri]